MTINFNFQSLELSNNTKNNLIIAGRVLVVAIIITGIVAATVFTGGAAAAAFGVALAATSGVIGKFVVAGALAGVAAGLGIGSVLSVWTACGGPTWDPFGTNAIEVKLLDVQKSSAEEIGKFAYLTLSWSALSVGWMTFKGIELGFKSGFFVAILQAVVK